MRNKSRAPIGTRSLAKWFFCACTLEHTHTHMHTCDLVRIRAHTHALDYCFVPLSSSWPPPYVRTYNSNNNNNNTAMSNVSAANLDDDRWAPRDGAGVCTCVRSASAINCVCALNTRACTRIVVRTCELSVAENRVHIHVHALARNCAIWK